MLGAYLCGFWAIPLLGLTRTLLARGLHQPGGGRGRGLRRRAARDRCAPEPDSPAEARRGARRARAFLFFFAVSGFVAIGYEIVWSKVFGIVMEGTLYGFAAVLSAYLLGHRRRQLRRRLARRLAARPGARLRAAARGHRASRSRSGSPRCPTCPTLYEQLAGVASGADAVHLLYLIVLPIVLLPTALFGAAFPILIRIYTRRAGAVGRGIGLATAVNTAGSIAASLAVGFWWIPAWGTDATLYALLWIDFAAALAALLAYQQSQGTARFAALFGSLAAIGCVTLAFGGVRIEDAISGRQLGAPDLARYRQALERLSAQRALSYEGRASVVTVYANRGGRMIRTNGMPEAGVTLAPPFYSAEAVALGVWPYALASTPRNALVIGLGGGNTVATLLRTQLAEIDVVELEQGVERAVKLLHDGMPNPLEDPRVRLHVDDGRNYLLRRNARKAPGYDLISSQPSHPWRVGAANLFTEDFFRIARDSLAEGGVFTAWLNGFRIDAESFLAVVASFERVFPGALLVDLAPGRQAYLLLGAPAPLEIDSARFAARIAEPELAALLAGQGIAGPADLLARIEGPTRSFAALAPDAANTDDNAFVETRTPRELAVEGPRLPTDRVAAGRGRAGAAAHARRAGRRRDRARAAHAARAEEPLALRREARSPAGSAPRGALAARARAAAPRGAAARSGPRGRCGARTARARVGASREPRGLAPARHLARRHRSAWREASDAFAQAFARTGAPRDAYDAGRALHPADPEAARRWFARIPRAARAAFPRLAYYDAQAALERGLRGDALAPYDAALERFLESDDGRSYPGAHELAGRVAFARGDLLRARRHADADAHQRSAQARPALARASAR